MNLTLITVNYNNARATIGLLRSLELQTARDFDVIVVDNDSTADDRELLGSYGTSSQLRLDIIFSDHNRGFSGGNNLAIRKALAQGSEWMLIINNDTTVAPDFIASLSRHLDTQPAIIALPLREGDRATYAGRVEWLCATLAHARHHPKNQTSDHLYAIGAAMVVHRSVFERVGLLDERYFLYFEDADYSLRAYAAHIPVRFADGPFVSHGVSQSTRALGSPLLLRYHMRNAMLFNRAHGPFWARMALPVWVLLIALKQWAKRLVRRNPEQSAAILAGISDALHGRWGRIRSVPRIAIECESLEDPASWGVARMVRGLLRELASRPEVGDRYTFDLYFKTRIPDEPWLSSPLIRTYVVRSPSWLPFPVSFSLYYYLFLPVRLWWDAPAATYWPNYMLPLIAPPPSIVMLTEDIWHEMRNTRSPRRFRLAYSIFSNFAARFATRIMAISHASATSLHHLFHIPTQRIAINALAVDGVRPGTVPMPGPYVLFVGQAFERRSLRESIRAFATIADRHPDMRFVAIGPDKYDPPIIDALVRETNATLGRPAVQHIVRVSDEDLARFYAGAHTLVYVSQVEAFGLPPLEALSYGIPSVLADTPLNREIYGPHAFYAASTTVQGIAEALERSITDDEARRSISEQAQSIIARYTWKAHADRMLSIFDSILHSSS